MNATAATNLRGRWVFTCLTLVLCAATAWGQSAAKDPVPPLYLGNIAPVMDQYGRPMRGSPEPSDVTTRCRVEIRVAPYPGVRVPPGTNGAPHPLNPLVAPDSIGGIGLNASQPDSGIFCMIFPERLSTNTMVFARVFNAPTLEESTFYADSKAVAVPLKGSSLVFEFDPAQPLDGGDIDGDWLNNSWERFLGIDDRQTADYDGDGMIDLHEMLAGTDPNNVSSLLALHWVRREVGTPPSGARGEGTNSVRLKWQAVPGKRYQVQYSLLLNPDPVTGEPREFNLAQSEPIVAGEGETEIDMQVDVPGDVDTRMFRIRLVPDDE